MFIFLLPENNQLKQLGKLAKLLNFLKDWKVDGTEFVKIKQETNCCCEAVKRLMVIVSCGLKQLFAGH